MTSVPAGALGHAEKHAGGIELGKLIRTYVFSLDHKIIGLQF